MIIKNNNSNNGNNFENQNNFKYQNQSTIPNMNNNFENRFNKVKEYNQERTANNVFVKNIQEQKYASSTDTHGMQDRTLAMLHDRLEKGTISLEEFNRKCAQLGHQRQNISKDKNLF